MGRRIGVLGGSFDPLHYGHLILAEQIRQEARLDKVIFVPAYVSPFKAEYMPAEGRHRMEMLRMAIDGHSAFDLSDIEIKREKVSYTYDTLMELKNGLKPEDEVIFIMGTDAFLELERWHKAEELIDNFSFLIGLRKGYDEARLESTIKSIKEKYPLKAEYIRIPELEISSSDIKKQIGEGKSVKFLMPDRVLDYIRANGLYMSPAARLRAFAKENESPARFSHSEGVVKLAKELALKYGADPQKAEIAGWFHDVCRAAGNLEHGFEAAEILKNRFGIEDEDVLNAVRYHTTGRPGMSLLEKVIKIADQLEEGRDYPGIEDLRRLTELDVDNCLYRIMLHTRDYVKSTGAAFDPLSEEAILWLESLIKQGGNDEK